MRTPLKLLFLSSALTLMIACGGDDGSTDSATTTSALGTSESGATVVSIVDPTTTTSEVSEQVPTNTDLPALGECPTMVFPDLSDVAGPGGDYAMPSVAVECTDTELVVTSNGMPGYEFVEMTPNGLQEQNWEWRVALKPEVADEPTSIVDVLGPLGFTTTGLPIYGPTEGPMPEREAFGDPVYNGLLDDCGGHTGFNADYHNHALNAVASCNLDSSFIIGYALDGFPIYNSVGCLDADCTETAVFVSGYDLTGDPTSYSWKAYTYNADGKTNVLDECNGRVGPDGTYRYHATTAFPYIIGCLRGTATTQTGNAAAPMPPMGGPPPKR
ncbi:MAG: YHYH protein [Acidimicrobiia bacterium]|nr:YHYH protein [Acidimicrobiia bacterium]